MIHETSHLTLVVSVFNELLISIRLKGYKCKMMRMRASASSCVTSLFAFGYMNEIQHRVCALLMSLMPSILKECHKNRWILGHRPRSIKENTHSWCNSIETCFNIASRSHMFSRYMMLIKWWCSFGPFHLMFLRHTSKTLKPLQLAKD